VGLAHLETQPRNLQLKAADKNVATLFDQCHSVCIAMTSADIDRSHKKQNCAAPLQQLLVLFLLGAPEEGF
jgi:hypothetical protein